MKNFKISQSITDRKDASLALYFRDVSKLSLITPEEEIELTKRIKLGDNKATNDLVTANLRFVISVAKQYQNKGLDLVDLIQEGNVGLINGALHFDESKGCKFISYAVWWIRQAILKAISDQCRTVRVPMSQIVNIMKVKKASEKFEQLNEREPSVPELEEATNLNNNKVHASLTSDNRSISLDTPFKDEEVGCLLDVLPNTNIASTDDEVSNNSLVSEIERVLSKLSNRDSDILKLTFGIGVQQLNGYEIANRFGIGSERVRQIQHSAMNKIKKKFGKTLIDLL